MIEEDTLPDYLIDEWKKTLKMKTGKLAKQRELINQAFDREKGQLVLNLKKPSFNILKDCLGWVWHHMYLHLRHMNLHLLMTYVHVRDISLWNIYTHLVSMYFYVYVRRIRN